PDPSTTGPSPWPSEPTRPLPPAPGNAPGAAYAWSHPPVSQSSGAPSSPGLSPAFQARNTESWTLPLARLEDRLITEVAAMIASSRRWVFIWALEGWDFGAMSISYPLPGGNPESRTA